MEKKQFDSFELLTRDDVRAYFERWRRNKSKKFQAAVDKAAQEMAVEMFMDLVKELDRARKNL